MFQLLAAATDKSLLESLQEEMTEMDLLYIDQTAIQIQIDIGEGNYNYATKINLHECPIT